MNDDEGIVVLSLFDGMSCGMIALERAGIKVSKYYASEVDKHAIQVSKHNYPNIIHIGDVTKVSYSDGMLHTEMGTFWVGKVDLLLGGSPCQDFSVARTMGNKTIDGLMGDKSSLFYEYLRIKREVDPLNFLLENVKMKVGSKEALDNFLGVKGVEINSELVSYQHRRRIYWSNIPFDIPKDKMIDFQNFKESDKEVCREYKANKTKSRIFMWNNGQGRNSAATGCGNVTNKSKIYCLTTKQDRSPNSGLIEFEDFFRYLTRGELEQAQTVPLGYTSCLSYGQASKVLGNGWTVDVIAHILKNMKVSVEEDYFAECTA